jgi:hypothetical protein
MAKSIMLPSDRLVDHIDNRYAILDFQLFGDIVTL